MNAIEILEDRTLLTSYFSGDVNLPIPDQGQVVSTINVADSFTVADVNVEVNISHGSDQDLDVYLIAPDGTRIELFTDVGGGGDDFIATTLDDEAATPITAGSAPFTGTFRPEGSLITLDGKNTQGDWQLEVNDDKRRNTGTLNSWSIDITPDQPPLPQISIDDVALVEGDSGTTAFTFTVSRSGDVSGTSSVDFATADGTALAGTDYVGASGTVQFLATETTKTITIEVNGDTTDELDESFVVDLSNAMNATVSDAHGAGTILDDDREVIPNDPEFTDQWTLNNTGQTGGAFDADIDMPAAWSVTTGDMSTVVAVLGTGVEYTHEDLYLNIWLNPGEIPSEIASELTDSDNDGLITFRDLNDSANANFVSDLNGTGYIDAGDLLADPSWEDGIDTDGNGFIDDLVGWDFVDNDNEPLPVGGTGGHETGIALKIGAIANNGFGTAGINWQVRMMPMRTGTQPIIDNFDAAVLGLNYAVAEGAPISANAWGNFLAFDQALYDAIDAARLNDHLFIAAAGNQQTDNDGSQPAYPASFDLDNIISVAGVDHNDALVTNFGLTSVDLAASGPMTSSGSAHTVGIAALLSSLHPEWTYSQVKTQILSTVDPLPSLVGITVTGGRLNAAAALSTSSIHMTDPVLVEGNSGTTAMVFTVSRRGDTSQSLTLAWMTEDGTATAGSDYVAGSGEVVFGVGATTQTISVAVNGDNIEEADETFYLNLGIASGNATIADAKSQGTIQNDDVSAGFSVTGLSPDSAIQNQQLIVEVTGTGFVDGATADFGTKVNVLDVTFVSSTQLDVLIKVHRKASTGSRDVTITNPDNSSDTLVGGFTVTASLLAETSGDGNGIIPLSQADAESFTELALQLWIGAEGISDVPNFDVFVADLPGNQLGMFDGNTITLDIDAAGVGWFVDTTPFDNSEFANGVYGYDLLTVAAHEVGHALGFDHDHEGVMEDTLAVGERHLPGEEHHPESRTLVIPVFDLNNQDDSTSNDSLGTGVITSLQLLAEKFDYALDNDFDTSLTDDDFDSNEPVPYLPEEDLDADSFFSEFADSLLDDLLAIA